MPNQGRVAPINPVTVRASFWALGASLAIGFGSSNAGEGEGLGRRGKRTTPLEMAVRLSSSTHLSTCPQLPAERQEHFLLTDTMTHSTLSPAVQASSPRQEEPSPACKAWGLAWTAPGRCLGPYSFLAPGDSGSARTSSSMPVCQVSVTAPLLSPPPPSNKTIIFPPHEVSCFSLHFFGFLFSQATQSQHTVRHQDCR